MVNVQWIRICIIIRMRLCLVDVSFMQWVRGLNGTVDGTTPTCAPDREVLLAFEMKRRTA